MDTSKLISEFFRHQYAVRASHARELAAAFLGYKSHAAYLALTTGQQWSLDRINLLIPDLDTLESRLKSIGGLPAGLPGSRQLAEEVCDDLRKQGVFRGSVILAKDLDELKRAMSDGYLQENISLEDRLTNEIAISNSWFFYEEYDNIEARTTSTGVTVTASGVFYGEHDDDDFRDRPNHGDKIDFNVELDIQLTAWNVGFWQKIDVDGKLRSNYA